MTIEIPTQAQIAAFQNAWEKADAAGLAGMRTLAGLTAVLNMPSPTAGRGSATPKVIIDKDNDRWEQVPDTNLWHCTTTGVSDSTEEDIERRFGPITKERA